MRLACADSAFPKLSFATTLAVIRDLGLPAVDVCVFPLYGHTAPDAVRANADGTADSVGQLLADAGLVASDVFLILGAFNVLALNDPRPAIRNESLSYFEGAVRFASRIGAPGITVLPGVEFDGVEPAESRRLAAAELQRRAQLAGEAGLALSIEPHYESIAQTPETALELLDAAPDVTLALDLSHFVYQGIPQDDADVLFGHTRHVHLRQAGAGDMQLPTREGEIDFRRLRDGLARSGYDGFLAIEYQWEEWLDCRRVDCVSETAELRDLLLTPS